MLERLRYLRTGYGSLFVTKRDSEPEVVKAVTALHTRPANHGTPCHKVSESHLIEPCRNASACCLQCIWVFQEVFHDVAINEQLKVFIASCMVTSSSDAQLLEQKRHMYAAHFAYEYSKFVH